MRKLALFIGLFAIVTGVVCAAAPDALLSLAGYFLTPLGLYVAAALRITFGVVLLGAAGASRAPRTLRVLGVLVFVNGLLTPVVGVDHARAMVDWWSSQGQTFMRLWSGFALAFGVFVVYAVAPVRRAA